MATPTTGMAKPELSMKEKREAPRDSLENIAVSA
jgi:hypothetical protein